MESLAGERVEEARPRRRRAASPSPARRATPGSRPAPRPRARRRSAATAHGHRVVVGGRDRGHHGADATAAAPSGRSRSRQRRLARTIPTLTRPPGTGREPDVAAVEHDHPRVADRRPAPGRRRGRSGPGDRRAAADGRRRRPGRRPIAARRRRRRRAPRSSRAVGQRAPVRRGPSGRRRPSRTSTPGVAGELEQERIERRPVEPDGRASRASRRRRRSGGTASRRPSRRASPGSGARRVARSASASPSRRSAATVAGDVNTPHARQRQAGARSTRSDVATPPRQPDRRRRAGRPATDDQDLAPLHRGSVAAHPVARVDRGLSGRRSRPGGRRTRRSSRRAPGRRPRRGRAAPAGVYARRTESGPSWRVNRLVADRMDRGASAPSQFEPAADRGR